LQLGYAKDCTFYEIQIKTLVIESSRNCT